MISRRCFFTKLAGTVLAAHVVPSLPAQVWGTTGGSIPGAFIESPLTPEQIAEWFNVPPKLIGTPTLRLHIDGKALAEAVARHHVGYGPEPAVTFTPAVLRRQGL